MRMLQKYLRLYRYLFPSLFFLTLACENPSGPPRDIEPVIPNNHLYPSWSPDGTTILYFNRGIVDISEQGCYYINPDSSGIWINKLDGTSSVQLINTDYAIPNWSADGNDLIFSTDEHIYSIPYTSESIDSINLKQLTHTNININPTCSADNLFIYYDSNASDPETLLYSIWRMHLDGSNREMILHFADDPDISVDGNTLLFRKYVDYSAALIKPEIHSYNLVTQEMIQISFLQRYSHSPKYTSDGSSILFRSEKQIMIMNANGSNLRILCNGGSFDISPSGDRIVFSNAGGCLWIMALDGSLLYQLTDCLDY